MSGASNSYVSVQYASPWGQFGCVVVRNTEEEKEHVEDVLMKLLGVRQSNKGKGTLTFGPPGTAGEALAYNQGYGAGMAAVGRCKVVDAPDLVDPNNGEVLIRGNKKPKK